MSLDMQRVPDLTVPLPVTPEKKAGAVPYLNYMGDLCAGLTALEGRLLAAEQPLTFVEWRTLAVWTAAAAAELGADEEYESGEHLVAFTARVMERGVQDFRTRLQSLTKDQMCAEADPVLGSGADKDARWWVYYSPDAVWWEIICTWLTDGYLKCGDFAPTAWIPVPAATRVKLVKAMMEDVLPFIVSHILAWYPGSPFVDHYCFEVERLARIRFPGDKEAQATWIAEANARLAAGIPTVKA